jgi:predicted metal-dependent peptidase
VGKVLKRRTRKEKGRMELPPEAGPGVAQPVALKATVAEGLAVAATQGVSPPHWIRTWTLPSQSRKFRRIPCEQPVESLLGELVKPQLRFVDIVRSAMMRKVQDAGMKNDWKRFRRRYISATPRQYLPKRHTHMPRWLCMLDTSGSMSDDDIRFGISQLQVLGNQTEGTVVPCDAEPHWEAAVKVRNMAELKKTRPVGRGGTDFTTYLRDFPTKMGTDFDVLVIITDGYCGEIPLELKPKKMDVCWVITRPDHEAFKPPFGRVCRLREHHL